MSTKDSSEGVLVIYTGGTIGSVVKDKNDPLSPLLPGDIKDIIAYLPNYHERDSKIRINDHQVRLGTYSWRQPIDSTNIKASDWIDICRVISDAYREYEGFVVLHGTDTMAYTASCLAFMLDNLEKPVVITGSQKPIGSTRSDAVQNVISAIEVAAARSLGHIVVPEVTVMFQDTLYRGCRLRKVSASSFAGFDSPNLPPLGKLGEHVEIRKELLRDSSGTYLSVADELNEAVISIDIFPGMKPQMLEALLGLRQLEGVVMKTFGTGNVPSDPAFLAPIKSAVRERDLMIVNVTQCLQGEVEQGLYDVSAGLLSAGVISGLDMTPEAALTKMFVVLGKKNLTKRDAADMMQLNLRGEQRRSVYNVHFKPVQGDWPLIVSDTVPRLLLKQDGGIFQGHRHGSASFSRETLERAYLRIVGLRIPGADDGQKVKGRIEFKVYIDEPNADEKTAEEGETYIGTVDKRYDSAKATEENAVLDITDRRRLFDVNREVSLTIVPLGSQSFEISRVGIALYTA